MRGTPSTLLIALVCAGGLALFGAPPPRKAAKPAPKAAATRTTASKSTARPAAKRTTATASSRKRATPTASRSKTTARRGYGRSPQPVAQRRSRGQGTPTNDRYTEIQRALATRGYYEGEPSGSWDNSSMEALKRFQKDQNLPPNGKITSLSLIALGLGPKRDTNSIASLTAPQQLP